jgi:hypothetical protein
MLAHESGFCVVVLSETSSTASQIDPYHFSEYNVLKQEIIVGIEGRG